MRTALGTIDLVQMLKGKLELGGQIFDSFSEAPFRKWRQFVEEWLNDSRIDKDHQDLEGKPGRWCFSSKKQIVGTGRTYKNAIKNGMKLSPAHLKIFKNAARNGAPSANPTDQPLIVSMTNSLGVVLLNPCFSSRTKV